MFYRCDGCFIKVDTVLENTCFTGLSLLSGIARQAFDGLLGRFSAAVGHLYY